MIIQKQAFMFVLSVFAIQGISCGENPLASPLYGEWNTLADQQAAVVGLKGFKSYQADLRINFDSKYLILTAIERRDKENVQLSARTSYAIEATKIKLLDSGVVTVTGNSKKINVIDAPLGLFTAQGRELTYKLSEGSDALELTGVVDGKEFTKMFYRAGTPVEISAKKTLRTRLLKSAKKRS